MEGSCETECMHDENDSERKINGGSSSNNSCVEESSKKPSVRPYVRSKTPRLRWTPDLHLRFLQAVERLGGQERATPKLVLQLMNMKGLNIAHVKSHLQMHRSKKFEELNYQGMANEGGLLVEGVDRNIYNLSRLPLLPNFNQRCGDVFWNGEARWIDRTGFYERMLSSHYYRSANLDLYTKLASYNERSDPRSNEMKCEFGSPHKQETCQSNPVGLKSIQLTQHKAVNQQRISSDNDHEKSTPSSIGQNTSFKRDMTLKRKATDCELGLNLTLGLISRNHEQLIREREEESNLSLSLYPTSSSSKLRKLNENLSSESRSGVSTLDLTL